MEEVLPDLEIVCFSFKGHYSQVHLHQTGCLVIPVWFIPIARQPNLVEW